jgi:AraC family transcriptional regulator
MKGAAMDSLANMNQALAYIEETLTGDIDFKHVEKLALCSEFHFRKMFSALAGITLSEYIRRRRMTLAAFELLHSDVLIIDLALKYGYNSPDSFTRAFRAIHGMTPSQARDTGQPLKAYHPLTFQLTIKGGNAMNYRIEEKAGFYIVGIMKRVPLVYEGVNPAIAAMWQTLNMV